MSLYRQMLRSPRLLSRCKPFIAAAPMRCYADHNPPPMCSSKNGDCGKTVKNACGDDEKIKKKKDANDDFQFHHLIKFPKDCCDVLCPDQDMPRFDECFYKESDKLKRKYQVTWVECPPIKIKPKKICCYERATKPPVPRRKPKNKPQTACEEKPKCTRLEGKCPKVHSPGCRDARDPPSCQIIGTLNDCKKVKTPYPSFSECKRPPLRAKRRIECNCLDGMSMCEMYAVLKKLENNKNRRGPCG